MVDDADWNVKEANLPGAALSFLNADRFAYERRGNVDQVTLPFDLAVGPNLADRRFGRITRLGKPFGHCSRRRAIDTGRRALAERLMRSLFVVVTRKGP